MSKENFIKLFLCLGIGAYMLGGAFLIIEKYMEASAFFGVSLINFEVRNLAKEYLED